MAVDFDDLPAFKRLMFMSMDKTERIRFRLWAVNRGIPLEDALDEWIAKHSADQHSGDRG